jgi:hypothetical protein
MRSGLLAALAAIAAPAAPAAAGPFDWLVGRWCTAGEKGVRTCETWSGWTARGMRGESVTIRAGRPVATERMVIRLAGGRAAYDATPGGAPKVTFRESARGREWIRFENRRHDYPQRIRYWRDGTALLAEISLADGSRKMGWRYLPVAGPVAGAPPRR